MKLIGLIIAWGAEPWIKPAIEQAKEYCDETLACISAHSKELEQFEDNSKQIAIDSGIQVVDVDPTGYHAISKAKILNELVKKSSATEGDWVWILDADEFYDKQTYKMVKKIIRGDKFDCIRFGAKFFLINMRHYITSEHPRVFKLKPNAQFTPTQHYPVNYPITIDEMFHYSLLTNPYMRKVQWENEYPNKDQKNKVKWLNNYLKGNMEKVWMNPDRGTDNGKLFKYKGKHPKFVRHLTKIKDFRKYYG